MIYMGIDPGKRGAIAALDKDDQWTWQKWTDNTSIIAEWLSSKKIEDQLFCAIERAGVRKGQGIVSSGKFMWNYGLWEGMLTALRIPYIIVIPQKWQSTVLDNRQGDTKERSISMVSRLYGIDLKKSEDGVADAINIARYAKQYKAH